MSASVNSSTRDDNVLKRLLKMQRDLTKLITEYSPAVEGDLSPKKAKDTHRQPTAWAQWIGKAKEAHPAEFAEFRTATDGSSKGVAIQFAKSWRESHTDEYAAFESTVAMLSLAYKPVDTPVDSTETPVVATVTETPKKVKAKSSKKATEVPVTVAVVDATPKKEKLVKEPKAPKKPKAPKSD
jgi:hypothetical protein